MVYKLVEPKFDADERPFFAGFPGFQQDPKASVSAEFARLAKSRGWGPGSKNWKLSWNLCMESEYDRLIGERVSSLELWQELCRKLNLDGDLPSIRKCRMALRRVHVNIVDLLDCWNSDRHPKMFANVHQLAKYTKREKKFFNREIAKQDKVLPVLLKKII